VFVALVIQHAKRMGDIVFSFAASLDLPYFPHYLTKGTIFEEKKVIEYTMCFDFPYNFCLKYFSF